MNVLKSVKNVKSRNLITIHVEKIESIKPAKIVLISKLVETNYKILNNPLDVKLVFGSKEFFIKDIQRIASSIYFEEARSMNAEIMIFPVYRLCEIHLIKSLSIAQIDEIMLLSKQ